MKLESLLQYMDEYLGVSGHPDYPTALNGLQVDGAGDVTKVVAAVDATQATIEMAAAVGADLMIVHHGLFWDGLRPVTGRRFKRLKALLDHGIALYACHLPLDAHPEVGNCALLARALGLELTGRFGRYQDAELGWVGRLETPLSPGELRERTSQAVGGPVQLIPGGPDQIERVGVVTGGAGGLTEEASKAGLDAFVTGEAAHHNAFDAHEGGVHLLLAGHYATETFGVRALAEHIADRFGLEQLFVDQPTGL